ncbi:hypothetical protein QUF80_11650 [Desulfococcaceae bacterium HSG8]|nr:hypothetical protein [Desulfococcaceae bacterium HSG8]
MKKPWYGNRFLILFFCLLTIIFGIEGIIETGDWIQGAGYVLMGLINLVTTIYVFFYKN